MVEIHHLRLKTTDYTGLLCPQKHSALSYNNNKILNLVE